MLLPLLLATSITTAINIVPAVTVVAIITAVTIVTIVAIVTAVTIITIVFCRYCGDYVAVVTIFIVVIKNPIVSIFGHRTYRIILHVLQTKHCKCQYTDTAYRIRLDYGTLKMKQVIEL
jgi:hypothetical protein